MPSIYNHHLLILDGAFVHCVNAQVCLTGNIALFVFVLKPWFLEIAQVCLNGNIALFVFVLKPWFLEIKNM